MMLRDKRELIRDAAVYTAVRLGAAAMGEWFEGKRYDHKFVRALNFHSIPASELPRLRDLIGWLDNYYVFVGPNDLGRCLRDQWEHDKPGILLTFDDGLWEQYRAATTVLDELSVPGVFFIPSALIGLQRENDRPLAKKHNVSFRQMPPRHERLFMSWAEVRQLGRRHAIGSHTMHHRRLGPGVPEESIQKEICESKTMIEDKVQVPVTCFAWVGGETESYSRAGQRMIEAAGYQYAFMTASQPIVAGSRRLSLHRTNIETSFRNDRIRVSLSGLIDARYALKRQRIARSVS